MTLPPQSEMPASTRVLIALAIALVAIAVYAPIVNHEFLNFDDNFYVSGNPHVQGGLNLEGITEAFRPQEHTYFHPLTWFSHMLDWELFGNNAGMHHLMSAFWHAANAALLFITLGIMTGGWWTSAAVALLFTLHPVNVDSVAWIAERKNLLSTFFWFSTMLAYTRYVRRPSIPVYGVIITTFTLGLLAKPMLVTLPLALMLLDYWPLARFNGLFDDQKTMRAATVDILKRLFINKLPLLVLSAASVWISTRSVEQLGIVIDFSIRPLGLRVSNAIVSYIQYLGKLCIPINFSVFYPYPDHISAMTVAAALAVLALISFWALIGWRLRPWRIVGWCWFLGTMVPVLGIYQSGLWPAYADRWMYVPAVGLFMAVAWELTDLTLHRPRYKRVVAGCAALAILALGLVTRENLPYWKNSDTLFRHALAVTEKNDIALRGVAYELMMEKHFGTAREYLEAALSIAPENNELHFDMGNVMASLDRPKEALFHFREAIRLAPGYYQAHCSAGNMLRDMGETAAAIAQYRQALRLSPDYRLALHNLGVLLIKTGFRQEGLDLLQKVLAMEPSNADAQFNLGNAYSDIGDRQEAISHYQKAIALNPAYAEAHLNIGTILIELGQIDKAVSSYRRALHYQPEIPMGQNNLQRAQALQQAFEIRRAQIASAIAASSKDPLPLVDMGDIYREIRNYDRAVDYYQKALDIDPKYARATNNMAIAHAFAGHLNEAAFYFTQTAALTPNSEKVYYNLACIQSRRNDLEAAMAALKRAVSLGYNRWEKILNDDDLSHLRASAVFKTWWKSR
ncbi:MAG: tetratricopeptide repeat protein [Pseudomonadota bacterium]